MSSGYTGSGRCGAGVGCSGAPGSSQTRDGTLSLALHGEFLTMGRQGSPQYLSLYLAQNYPGHQHSCLGSDVIDFQ